MAFGTVILLATNMCGPPWPRSGRMLLESSGHPYYPLRITSLPSPGSEVSDHEAGCTLGQRGCCHSQGGSSWDQEVVEWQHGAFAFLQLLDTADLPGITALIVPIQCYQEERKRPSGLARVAAYPKPPQQRSHRLPALASVTGLEVLVMRIPYRSGFRPTGPQWCCNSCSRRRITIVQKTRLGWTRRRLLRTFSSNGNATSIAGVFRQKGAAPWRITRGGEVATLSSPPQWSVFGGLVCRGVWPINRLAWASMLGADNLRKVAGYDFHLLRKKYDVRTMWGDLDPQWRLLQSQLWDERTWLVLTCRAQGTTLHK